MLLAIYAPDPTAAFGMRHAHIRTVEGCAVRRKASAPLHVHMHHGVVNEGIAAAAFVEHSMVDVVENVPDDRDLGRVRIVRPPADCARGIRRTVPVHVHEDVPFHPGIRAVEIQDIIVGPGEDIVDHLEDRTGSVATREIDGVVVAARRPKEAMADDSPSVRANAAKITSLGTILVAIGAWDLWVNVPQVIG